MKDPRFVKAEVRCWFETDPDWWVTWSGNALDISSIERVCRSIADQGGKARIFIPDTNTFYEPHKYRHVMWVRRGLQEHAH